MSPINLHEVTIEAKHENHITFSQKRDVSYIYTTQELPSGVILQAV